MREVSSNEPLRISHFSDVLCVWAYISQIRIDELKRKFGRQIQLAYHFIPVFGCTRHRIGEGWKDRGGYEAFNEHVRHACGDFPHVELNDRLWIDHPPRTSGVCHHFLKAIQVLEREAVISREPQAQLGGNTLLEEVAWRLRLSFFRDNLDLSRLDSLIPTAEELGLPVDRILDQLSSGEAMAALCRDAELKDTFGVQGSPTYVLNEGRQKLYGNLGYRILEANVQEVLQRPEGQASWC